MMSNNENVFISSILDLGYKETDKDDYLLEILGVKDDEIKNAANQLNHHIRNVSSNELKRIASPITMRVSSINDDGTINVNKPTDKDASNNCWTRIPNPTIFQHLEVGDEVLLGYYEGEQKSNCWVMFAKAPKEDMYKKTILKDIDNIYVLDHNINILKDYLYSVILETYKDIEQTGVDENNTSYTYYIPHPKRLQFEREMADQWKGVVK